MSNEKPIVKAMKLSLSPYKPRVRCEWVSVCVIRAPYLIAVSVIVRLCVNIEFRHSLRIRSYVCDNTIILCSKPNETFIFILYKKFAIILQFNYLVQHYATICCTCFFSLSRSSRFIRWHKCHRPSMSIGPFYRAADWMHLYERNAMCKSATWAR